MKYVRIKGEPVPEVKEKLFLEFSEWLDFWLGVYDKRLVANTTQKYLVGDKITIADFMMFRIGYGYFFNEGNEF